MKVLPRILAPQVQRALRTSPVVVLGGSRQTGKSTLVRQGALGRGRRYLSLDDLDVLDRALRTPEALLRDSGRLTLDEVQRAPELLLAVKRAVANQSRTIRIPIHLRDRVARRTAGRTTRSPRSVRPTIQARGGTLRRGAGNGLQQEYGPAGPPARGIPGAAGDSEERTCPSPAACRWPSSARRRAMRSWSAPTRTCSARSSCSLYARVYENPLVKEEFDKAQRILVDLWEWSMADGERLWRRYGVAPRAGEDPARAVTDWISGMTDRFALQTWEEIFVPRPWAIG